MTVLQVLAYLKEKTKEFAQLIMRSNINEVLVSSERSFVNLRNALDTSLWGPPIDTFELT